MAAALAETRPVNLQVLTSLAETASKLPETVEEVNRLLAAGVAPCGLGARDTLRLEAAMNLYGSDMDETISPLEAGMGWTIAWEPEDREFNGRGPLTEMRANKGRRRFAGSAMRWPMKGATTKLPSSSRRRWR